MVTKALRFGLTTAVIAVIPTAAAHDTQTSQHIASYPREFIELGPPTLQIGGTATDTLVLDPVLLDASSNLILLYDRGDTRLKAFDAETGRAVWMFGRAGEGPGEFRNPTQIALRAGSDDIWVLDGALRRVLIIRHGSDAGSLSLQAGSDAVQRIVRLRDATLATLFSTDDRFMVTMDSLGRAGRSYRFPEPPLASANRAHKQSFVDAGVDGESWLTSFLFTNAFAVYRISAPYCRGVAPVGPSPADLSSDTNPTAWIASAALGPPFALMLSRTSADAPFDIVDFYRSLDCQYVASVRLPSPARAIAATDRGFVVAYLEPIPALVTYALPDGMQ